MIIVFHLTTSRDINNASSIKGLAPVWLKFGPVARSFPYCNYPRQPCALVFPWQRHLTCSLPAKTSLQFCNSCRNNLRICRYRSILPIRGTVLKLTQKHLHRKNVLVSVLTNICWRKSRMDAFKIWLAKNSNIAVQDQISLTEQGKPVKFQGLSSEVGK